MSDPTVPTSRPVSLITIVSVLVLFALFFFVVRYFYQPTTVAPQVATPENFSKDLAWRATRESRHQALVESRQADAEKAGRYGWVDQPTGVVRLPIERAMELTAQQYGKKQ